MDNVRIHVPLLEGDYNPLWTIESRAQMLFLDVVSRVTPRPLYGLRDEILPKYRAAFQLELKRGRSASEIRDLSSHALVDLVYKQSLRHLKLPSEIRRAMNAHGLLYKASAELITWSERFNLRGKGAVPDASIDLEKEPVFERHRWPLVAGLNAVLFWSFSPIGSIWEYRNPPGWCPPALTLRQPLPEPEVLPPVQLRTDVQDLDSREFREVDVPGWYIGLESATQFRKRMKEAFGTWLNAYMASRVRSARDAGWKETPGKRKLLLHFTWTAKFQIDGLSPGKIGRENNVAKDTVEDAIEESLDLIHLERRPPKRGGPKGGGSGAAR